MANIKIDVNKLNAIVNRSFDRTIDRVSEAMDNAITDDIYDFPRETKRRNKTVATSPRDIVDLGNLLDSKEVARSANAAEFSWNVDYALGVHSGYTTKTGKDVPARKWTEKGIEEADPVAFFSDALGREL